MNLMMNKEGRKMKFYGYPRPDGKAGARNYVALIPATGCVNAVCHHIESWIRGTKAITHHQGCLQRSFSNGILNLFFPLKWRILGLSTLV